MVFEPFMHQDTAIHMIGNAHIDIIWLWKWEEGLQEIRATFASALDRIQEQDGFIFTCACAYYYSMVEKTDPALFERIKEAVRTNRWRIAGGWWLQPDCNAPSGESFVRQSLYGQGYFKEKFGKTAAFGYNVDSFGHNGNLPQIFSKSGMDAYVFMRPGKTEKDLPAHLFIWEGVDGSRLTAYRIPPEYTNGCEWGPEL
jgi:alpha-mannosidase